MLLGMVMMNSYKTPKGNWGNIGERSYFLLEYSRNILNSNHWSLKIDCFHSTM